MTERVIVETDVSLEELRKALNGHGVTVEKGPDNNFIVHISDSRDAEEEITDAMNDAALSGYVYKDEQKSVWRANAIKGE